MSTGHRVVEHRFRAMASGVHLVLVDPAPGAVEHAVARIAELEARWSRFVPTSDVTQLNAASGGPVRVSADTARLLGAMAAAADATEGWYDPTVLVHVVDAGYDHSVVDGSRAPSVVLVDAPSGGIGRLEFDAATMSATLPCGVGIDPGGIGKGLAADIVVGELVTDHAAGALLSIGGDLACDGTAPGELGWLVDVEDPHDASRALLELSLTGGGVATSSTLSRRWRSTHGLRHHVIDPATGYSSATDLAAATVIAGAGWLAEAHALGALLEGSFGAIGYLERLGMTGLVVTGDGQVHMTADLEASRNAAEEHAR